LNEERCGESSASNLFPQIDRRVLYADRGKLLGQLLRSVKDPQHGRFDLWEIAI